MYIRIYGCVDMNEQPTSVFGSGRPYKWPLSNGPAPAFDTLEVFLPPQAFGNAMWRGAFRPACNNHGAVAPAASRVGSGQFGRQPGRSCQEETQRGDLGPQNRGVRAGD